MNIIRFKAIVESIEINKDNTHEYIITYNNGMKDNVAKGEWNHAIMRNNDCLSAIKILEPNAQQELILQSSVNALVNVVEDGAYYKLVVIMTRKATKVAKEVIYPQWFKAIYNN